MRRDRLSLASILIAVVMFTLTLPIVFAGDKGYGKGYTIEYLVPDRIVFIRINNPGINPTETVKEAIIEISKKYDIVPGSFTTTEYVGYGSATGGVVLFITPKL